MTVFSLDRIMSGSMSAGVYFRLDIPDLPPGTAFLRDIVLRDRANPDRAEAMQRARERVAASRAQINFSRSKSGAPRVRVDAMAF